MTTPIETDLPVTIKLRGADSSLQLPSGYAVITPIKRMRDSKMFHPNDEVSPSTAVIEVTNGSIPSFTIKTRFWTNWRIMYYATDQNGGNNLCFDYVFNIKDVTDTILSIPVKL